MFRWLDNLFCELEGKTTTIQPKGLSGTAGERMRQLFAVNGLDGWKDDKEKFKLDLINDIKTFLFGKFQKPWDGSVLFDSNGKVIHGFYNIHGRGYYDNANLLSLAMNAGESPFFITQGQIAKQGGTVTDAKKWVGIISWIPISDDDTDKVKFMMPRSHSVINVDFVDGIKKPIFKEVAFKEFELNEYIEAVIAELLKRKRVPKIHYDQADRCYYTTNQEFTRESIHLVNIKQFKGIGEYYSVLFHEIIHSTKNPARLGRGKNAVKLAYANEELVAEMGAMILCSELGLDYTRQNSLTYLNSWLKGVKGNADEAMLEAYSYACDAAEYLLADIDLASLVPQSMIDRANDVEPEPEKVTDEKTSKDQPIKKGTIAFVVKFYADTTVGTKGTVLKSWTDPKGNVWVKLYFGKNQTGQRLAKSFPLDVLSFLEPTEKSSTQFIERIADDFISYKSVERTYSGISFDPEKRAKSIQKDFANDCNEYAEKIEAICKTDEQKAEAKILFTEYVEKRKTKLLAWTTAMSRCLSPMITGPSNFPTRRNEKANAVEHKRSQEYIDYCKNAEKSILQRLKNIDKAGIESEASDRNTKEIDSSLATILGIVTGKLPYTKSLIVDAMFRKLDKMPLSARQYAIETAKEIQKKYSVTLFNAAHCFWKIADAGTARNADETPSTKPDATEETIFEADGIRIINNFASERVQIITDNKPEAEQIAWLKKNAFKWSPSNKAWQRQNTVAGKHAVKQFIAKFYPNTNPEPTKKVTAENTSTRKAILDIPVSDIHTDEKRFQNRANAYSEDSANRIIKAVENGTFDWAKFDPITIWNDKTGKFWVLSGHSRLAAFKTLAKTNKEFAYIPTTKFNGSEAEAIDLALNSNTLSTKETDAERAGYYHRMRQQCEVGNLKGLGAARTDCDKQVEAKCRDAEGKNANFILNLSYLAPRGYIMDSLHATGMERDNDSTNVLRTVANWIGEARRSFPQLSDVHETEIAKWLLNGAYGSKAGQFRKKQDFLERVRVALSKFKGGADDSINIAQNAGKTSFEKEWEKRLDNAKTELAEAEKDHAERYAKYLDAVMHGSITNERMLELMKPLTANVQKLREAVDAIKKQHGLMREAEGRQKSLFGISDINEQFNDELEMLIAGTLPKNHVFNLGQASDTLRLGGISNLTIELSAKRLYDKSKQENHVFKLDLLKNLPVNIQSPIAIFDSKTTANTKVVLIELKDNQANFVVIIRLREVGRKLFVNDIKSIYPKTDINGLIGWITNNLMIWLDKAKILSFLSAQSTILIGGGKKTKDYVTNVIRNFQNPVTPGEKNIPLSGTESNIDEILGICKSVYGDENVFEISKGSDNNFGLAPLGTAKRAKTSRLKGDIGAFLGEYDRHCYTIALKGDKGAGKSRLMFQLVNAYAGARLTCAILSLEMSPESSVIQNYADAYIEPKNKAQIAITGESQDYASLSKICALYDVVAIDSWNKVRGAVQTDFDRLQKEHPQCIIISIFQSTTGKVTRGGNMVEYDAGTVIQVNKGGHAVCEKNRYASTDLVFNVFDKKLESEAQNA